MSNLGRGRTRIFNTPDIHSQIKLILKGLVRYVGKTAGQQSKTWTFKPFSPIRPISDQSGNSKPSWKIKTK